MLVGRGTIYEVATVVHGMELGEDEVKVTVDEVVVPKVFVLVPTAEFITIAPTFKCFAAWPRHLVGVVSYPRYVSTVGNVAETDLLLKKETGEYASVVTITRQKAPYGIDSGPNRGSRVRHIVESRRKVHNRGKKSTPFCLTFICLGCGTAFYKRK
ncbi:hypothetical protein LR48_Vigan11g078000 [Vigna angularis]|uniref:DUF8039 domain-containing protein n=1 Tax=Phaseolus angularis TaxID=3914 RepID=A0A0L9VS95_PHAAN|nr:hypothetical protein LR48_Vigan11g078000 [Vigna angularis]